MRYLHLRLVGPAIAGVALLICGMAAVPYYGAVRIDDEARTRQETLVQRNIALWIADIEFSLTSWTIWDESIAKLDNDFDFEWADRNIGASLTGTSRTRFVAVLTATDALLYSRMEDAVGDRPFFRRGAAEIVGQAAPLVANVRAREHGPSGPGIPTPVALSRIEVLDQDAVLLTASLFQPDFGTAKPRGDRAPILITAMPIDSSLQDFFGTRFLLDDARVSPLTDVEADRARAEIATGPQGEVEVLSWRPPTPGANILYQTMPLILTVGVALLAGGFLTVRISQSTAQMLVGRERQMTHAATHDFLTGLANRALLEPVFRTHAQRGPLVVVCLDLDGFKVVNDTHGHAVGDDVLRVVAARLRAEVRDTDRLFRLGGDEFAILMPDIALHDAEQTCHRLSDALYRPMILPGHRIEIGVSFGLTRVADQTATCDTALQAADSALYQAKSLGRGRVVINANLIPEPAADDVHPTASLRA